MTDNQILQAALERWGNKTNIAKVLGIAPQTVSDWLKVRRDKKTGAQYIVPIPRAHRKTLQLLLGLPDGPSPPLTEPWLDLEWRRAHAVHKVRRQVEKLYVRTGGQGREWNALVNICDLLVPWTDKDWKETAVSLGEEVGGKESE